MKFDLIPINENMTFTENSYIAIDVNLEGDYNIYFYTPSQDKNLEYESLIQFNEMISESKFKFFHLDNNSYSSNDNTGTTAGVESKGSKGDYSYSGQLIHTYKDKKLDDIPKLINIALRDLTSLEKEAIEQNKENEEYSRDPYAYYGHKPSDFY